MSGFERYRKTAQQRTWAGRDIPRATIGVMGSIVLNRPARDLLGNTAGAVNLFYHREERLIGIAPVKKRDKDTFTLNANGQRENSSKRIMCKGFLEYYEIPYAETRRYAVVMQDDMLVIDLKKESEVVMRKNSRKVATDA